MTKSKARLIKARAIRLSARDVEFILDALDKTAREPTPAMKRALNQYKQADEAKQGKANNRWATL